MAENSEVGILNACSSDLGSLEIAENIGLRCWLPSYFFAALSSALGRTFYWDEHLPSRGDEDLYE